MPTRMAKVDPGRRGMHRHSPYCWAKFRSKQHGTRAPRTPASTDTYQQCACVTLTMLIVWFVQNKYEVKKLYTNRRIIHLWLVYVCVTCSFVSTDVKQARAPVSSRLRDGGNGCRGDAEAGLCDHWFRRCRDIIWPPVIFTSYGEAHHFLILRCWYWGIGDWQSRSESQLFN